VGKERKKGKKDIAENVPELEAAVFELFRPVRRQTS